MEEMKTLHLTIVSPERILFEGDADAVTLPGAMGAFMVLPGHAPIVSALTPGAVRYRNKGEENEISVKGGFAEVSNNEVSVCIEV